MKKHNENDGGARDLDALLQKLKERQDARVQTGIYTPEDEFRRRFFAAAKAQERPHFPMIWKAAAGIAVCLFAFQLVLTSLRDDSSAARADGYGASGVDMVAEAPAGYAAMPAMASSDSSNQEEMLLASVYAAEDDSVVDETPATAGFSGPMLRAALAEARGDDAATESEDARPSC